MLIFKFLESVFFALIFGYGILIIFLKDKDAEDIGLFEGITLSLGLGYGFMSLWMFCLSLLNIKFSLLTILFPILLLWLVLSLRKDKSIVQKFYKTRINFIKIALIILIGLGLVYSFCDTVSLPFVQWDSWGQYGLKAKIFYLEEGVWVRVISDYSLNIPNRDYPLLLPLIETYSYIFLGGVYEQYAKFVSYLFFIYILILFYYLIKRVASDNFSLLLTYFLSSVPLYIYSASSGYSDIPLVFYSGLGILYLRQSAAKNSNNLFRVGCLSLCLGAWTKKEGLVILLIGFIYWLLFLKPACKDKFKKIVFFILSVILINAPWLIFAKYYGLAGDNIYSLNVIKDYPLIINNIKIIALFMTHNLFDINRWNVFWLIFISVLFYKNRHIFKEKYLLSVITTYAAILILVYSICVNRDINWLLVTTFDRIILVFIPWIIYLVGVLYSGDFSYGHNNQRREGA